MPRAEVEMTHRCTWYYNEQPHRTYKNDYRFRIPLPRTYCVWQYDLYV